MKRPFIRLLWRLLRLALWRGTDMRRRVIDAEHALQLKIREVQSLEVQLTAYRDTVDSLSWDRRAAMAEAKYHAESLRHR